MSDAPSAPATDITPAGAQGTQAQQAELDDDALNRRVADKRARAEKNVGAPQTGEQQAGEARGADGKFKAKAKAEKTEKVEAKAEEKPDTESAKLKADLEKHTQRVADLEKRDSEWQSMAEQAYARINALEALIKQFQKGGAQLPESDAENITLREKIERHELAEQRAEHARKAAAEDEQRQADAKAVESLRSSLAGIVSRYPELAPKAGAPSLDFWRIVTEAHTHGGAAESQRTAERLAETFAKAIKAQAAPAVAPTQARTLANLGGTGGGAARDLSPEGIREKYAARMRAS